jgi:DNA-binding MarR family transcriptional regulator
VKTSELYLLGRHLTELARRGMADAADPDTPEVDAVIISVLVEARGMSISEVTRRTGFAQSHVSTSVARMREKGYLLAEVDPADRRRTLIRPIDAVYAAVADRQQRDVEQVLAATLAEAGVDPEVVPETAARLAAAADELYTLLTARALGQHGDGVLPLHSLTERWEKS